MPTTSEGWDGLEWLAAEYNVDKRIITTRMIRILMQHESVRSTVLQSFEDAMQPTFAQFILQEIAKGPDNARGAKGRKLTRPNVNVRQPKPPKNKSF